MEFATATEKGFGANYVNLQSDGSAMVSVGSSVERVESSAPPAPYESVEILVRVPAALEMTIENICRAALTRAALVLKEAAEALATQIAR
jgi:hypothetical protein